MAMLWAMGTDNRNFILLQRLMAVDGKIALMITSWYRI